MNRKLPRLRPFNALLTATAITVLCAVANATSATAPSTGPLTIRVGAIGPYAYAKTYAFPPAVRAFGAPDDREDHGTNLCEATWPSYGLEMSFASAPPACDRANLVKGAWYGATARGPRWRTDRGLAVGDDVSLIREHYPRAKRKRVPRKGVVWWLVVRRDEFGNPYGALSAQVRGGRVVALTLDPGYVF